MTEPELLATITAFLEPYGYALDTRPQAVLMVPIMRVREPILVDEEGNPVPYGTLPIRTADLAGKEKETL